MRALLVIDVQNGIVELGDFREELSKIKTVIENFREQQLPVIFIKHGDENEESSLFRHSEGFELHASLKEYAEIIVEKTTPSSFFKTELDGLLKKMGVDHLTITGFNTEFCCLFTAITAFDRGYSVTFIESATGTVNNDATYEMPGLDIKDFVGTVLHWSEAIEVLDWEEYEETCK